MMVLNDLIKKIKIRKNGDYNQSYTAQLFKEGLQECCKKFGEESVELIIAALQKNKDNNIKEEAADLIYHLLVLMEICNVDFEDILQILKRRMDQSGLKEKSSRLKSQ